MLRLDRVLTWAADGRSAPAVLLAAAVGVRLLLGAKYHFAPNPSELQQVAATWVETGRIADAFAVGSGPTTHTGPLAPALAAGVCRLVGSGAPTSEFILTIIAALVIGATALVLRDVFRRLGAAAWARGLATLVVVFLPFSPGLESLDLRTRESAIAALMLALVLWAALRLDSRERVAWPAIVGVAALVAVLFLLSPAAGLAAYAVCGVFALRKIPPARWIPIGLVAAAILVAVSAPWAIRNARVFGEPVWVRGNFGLEYALGTNPDAVAPADPAKTFQQTIRRIHPFLSKAAYRRVQQVGELAYARALEAQTNAWVAAHPLEAARIWVRHVWEFYCPPPWLWNAYSRPSLRMTILSILSAALTLTAFAGLAMRLVQRSWIYLYVAAPVAAMALPYILAQPRIRYRYVVASLITFLAFDAIARYLAEARATSRPARSPRYAVQAQTGEARGI
jgi:hypothetical protein